MGRGEGRPFPHAAAASPLPTLHLRQLLPPAPLEPACPLPPPPPRFEGEPDHFERAVLWAVNSGGNNMARAALTGALVGAMVGASRIPPRLIDGLTNAGELRELAAKVAADAFPGEEAS